MPEKLPKPYNVERQEPDVDDLDKRELSTGERAEPRERTRERVARLIIMRVRRMLQESKEKYLMRKRMAKLKREKAKLKREVEEKRKLGESAIELSNK